MWNSKNNFLNNINTVKNTYSLFRTFLLMLNVSYVCQVRVIRKKFAFTKACRYNYKLRDTNIRKVRIPPFELIQLLNGMEVSWYSVC